MKTYQLTNPMPQNFIWYPSIYTISNISSISNISLSAWHTFTNDHCPHFSNTIKFPIYNLRFLCTAQFAHILCRIGKQQRTRTTPTLCSLFIAVFVQCTRFFRHCSPARQPLFCAYTWLGWLEEGARDSCFPIFTVLLPSILLEFFHKTHINNLRILAQLPNF